MAHLEAVAERGATADEVHHALGEDISNPSSVSVTLGRLAREGRIVVTVETRITRKGREASVYVKAKS